MLIETELGRAWVFLFQGMVWQQKINTVFAYPEEKYLGYSLKVLRLLQLPIFRLYYDPLEDMFKTNKDWYDKENWTDYDLVQRRLCLLMIELSYLRS